MKDNEGINFWEHVEALRWLIIRVFIVMMISIVLFFIYMPHLFDLFILAPSKADFILYDVLCKLNGYVSVLPEFCNMNFHVEIVNINLASQFLTHMSLSFWLSFTLSFPYLIWEVWRFLSPALYPQEKKNIKLAFICGGVLFYIGCATGYLLVFPLTFRFLADYQLSDLIRNQVSLNSYMDNFMMLILVMGLVFEMPVLCWVLSKLGIVSKESLSKYRRHAIVILIILSSIITPSGDPFTLFAVFIPLYMLYELSILGMNFQKEENMNKIVE